MKLFVSYPVSSVYAACQNASDDISITKARNKAIRKGVKEITVSYFDTSELITTSQYAIVTFTDKGNTEIKGYIQESPWQTCNKDITIRKRTVKFIFSDDYRQVTIC